MTRRLPTPIRILTPYAWVLKHEGLTDGWILPSGDFMVTGRGGAREPHVTPFQQGLLPMPRGMKRLKGALTDDLSWTRMLVEKGNYIRVVQGVFHAKDLSPATLRRVIACFSHTGLHFADSRDMKAETNALLLQDLEGNSLRFTYQRSNPPER